MPMSGLALGVSVLEDVPAALVVRSVTTSYHFLFHVMEIWEFYETAVCYLILRCFI